MRSGLARIATGAAVALLLGAGAGCASSGGRHGPSVDPAGLLVAVVGTWRPVEIAGYVPPPQYPDALRGATITFDTHHRLQGTDGCNRFSVGYILAPDGSIQVGQGAMTAIGCANVPNDVVTSTARRVSIDNDQLVFLDADGSVLGRYERVTTGP